MLNLIEKADALGLNLSNIQDTAPDQQQTEKQFIWSYKSKTHAINLYDVLSVRIALYNQVAKRCQKHQNIIDGTEVLKNFYNKYCYVSSRGWHKLIFGFVFFLPTWIWRIMKYCFGKPHNRHQVKKSFSKDLFMCIQLIPEVLAPALRAFGKALLYALRMILGIGLTPVLLMVCGVNALVASCGLLCFLLSISYGTYKGIQHDDIKIFIDIQIRLWHAIRVMLRKNWRAMVCNTWVNRYIKCVGFVGAMWGTGSLHRISGLKWIGFTKLYAKLAYHADASSENLGYATRQLSTQLNFFKTNWNISPPKINTSIGTQLK